MRARNAVEAVRIQARAVAKVVAISLLVIAAAVLLALIVLKIETTLRWLFTSVFLALALAPAVDLIERLERNGKPLIPRVLAILIVYVFFFALFVFLILQVIPPIVSEIKALAPKLPGYVQDFEDWAKQNEDFQSLDHKYHLTSTLSDQASNLPSKLGGAAGDAESVTLSALKNLIAAITILFLSFFLLIDGGKQYANACNRFDTGTAERLLRIGHRIYGVVKGYVTVNLTLAIAAGVFTWLVLELLGVDLAVPLAVLVVFLDLIPLVGLTVAGLMVALAAAFHDFPTALIVWVAFFVVYQQLQDRVIQPLMYKNAVKVHPVVAIAAILIGAELLGIIGALLAIPVAASIGVLIDEFLTHEQKSHAEAPTGAQPEPAAD
jgi:predicted PurR-regulated permease PerM